MDEAKEVRKLFQEQILATEAWRRLSNYLNFYILQAGQKALAQPERALEWSHVVRGAELIRTVIAGAIEDIEVVDEGSGDSDDEILALTSLGAADPL